MASANNVDLAAAGSIRRSATSASPARAAFLPTLTERLPAQRADAPPSSSSWHRGDAHRRGPATPVSASGCRGAAATTTSAGPPRTNSNSILNSYNPLLQSGLDGQRVAAAAAQLHDRRHARRSSTPPQPTATSPTSACASWATTLTANAKRAYWNLVLARATVDARQPSLDLSHELVRMNKAKVDVGQSPPLDLVSAAAEVASGARR